jgi:acyl carrier protein
MVGNRRRPTVRARPCLEDLEWRTNLSALVLGASAGSPPRVSDIHVHSPIAVTTADVATTHGLGDNTRAPLRALTVSVKERVIDLVSEQLRVARDQITTHTTFKQLMAESGADSLDMVELVLRIEDEFNITIPDAEVDRIKTVGQAIQHVEKHIKSHHNAMPHPRDQVGGGHGPR